MQHYSLLVLSFSHRKEHVLISIVLFTMCFTCDILTEKSSANVASNTYQEIAVQKVIPLPK
jgi:hypothetical protein